jgi:hypothetical protein
MRSLILISAAALALCACGKSDTSENTQNVDQSLGAGNIVANDVTAIDAVTGDAANMAADVDYNELDNGLDNASGNASGNAAEPAKGRKPTAARSAPAGNSAANAAENAPQ